MTLWQSLKVFWLNDNDVLIIHDTHYMDTIEPLSAKTVEIRHLDTGRSERFTRFPDAVEATASYTKALLSNKSFYWLDAVIPLWIEVGALHVEGSHLCVGDFDARRIFACIQVTVHD